MDREINVRVDLGRELRGVLERHELFLEFQPQVELGRQTIAGAEALVRWRHPMRGPVPPDQFIPVAESSGQITAIGEWILHTACREARGWQRAQPGGVPVAVHLSPVQLRDPDFPEIVARTLERERLQPHLLELELTEDVFVKATQTVTQSLRTLHDEVGVSIALDNFGRGSSSLECLLRFPIDTLKVDRRFVASIDECPDARAMVRAILALGKSLRLMVVAEGLETRRQLEFLKREGCERAQGHYFSKPVRTDVLSSLLGAAVADTVERRPLTGSARAWVDSTRSQADEPVRCHP